MGKRDRQRQERAANAIRRALLASIENLQTGPVPWFQEVTTYYRVKKLKSGHVDAMLRIADLPDGIPVSELLEDLNVHDAFVTPKRYKTWVQIGFIGSFSEAPEPRERKKRKKGPPKGMKQMSGPAKRYDRYAGQEKVTVYSQRKQDLPTNIIRAQAMADTIEEGGARRPEEIFFRVYWGARPKRKKY